MKRTTKTIFGCLCMAMTFAFSGCGGENDYSQTETLNDKTPQQTYEAIMTQIESQKTNFTSTIKYDIEHSMKREKNKTSFYMTEDTTVKMDGNNFFYSSNLEGGTNFGWMRKKVSYIGGVAYIDSTSSYGTSFGKLGKAKYTAPLEKICEIAGLDKNEIFNPIYDFATTAFEGVKFYIGSDDSYFRLILKGDDAVEYIKKYIPSVNIYDDIELPRVSYKFVLDKDGNFDYAKIDFEITLKMEIADMVVEYFYAYDGEIRFTDVGTTVVTIPEDSDVYEDFTASLSES